ncbi:DUF3487 family protein [Erwinia tracheiphila]|uniref:DUF3487 family protein n=1 Tax=Erwinia tracheiphila TaxID=65700 RepID=A0A345CVN2_9GAMM|nr:DUF3487 family protein [Erwinia tracheiphila]
MATITFLPDRLNAEPIVFKGFTTPELFMTAGASVLGSGWKQPPCRSRRKHQEQNREDQHADSASPAAGIRCGSGR